MSSSLAEQEYCTACVKHGIRLDGREPCDFRPIELELGLIAQANGSARLHLGSTDVLVGVKVEVGVPDSSRPDCGRVQVTVECSACASPDYEVGSLHGSQAVWVAGKRDMSLVLSEELVCCLHDPAWPVPLDDRAGAERRGGRCWPTLWREA